MKRRTRRGKSGKKKILVVFFVLALLLSAFAFIFYSQLWTKQTLLLSPIASNNQSVTKTLENLLSDSDIEFSSVTFRSPSSYLVKLKEDGEAILSLDKDFRDQITSLQAVLKQLTIEGKRVIKIDFRFDKPVITLD